MHLLKPTWVVHGNTQSKVGSGTSPIFSLDVDPSGTRLATGGQDSRVKIWNMDPVRHEAVERDGLSPLLLASLSNHEGAVNCVRWCPKGLLLASGGDDSAVVFWVLANDKSITGLGVGNLEGDVNVEYWRCKKRLKGHELDVVDLAWSHSGKMLASCSFDNSIIIWNAESFAIVHKLAHNKPVKGVAWDPVGEYFISQSEDKTLAVWKTKDWSNHCLVRAPFERSGSTLFFHRTSWSPDGMVIAAAHAYNENQRSPVAALIQRDTWVSGMDLVGHTAPVQVAKFNPRMFHPPNTPASERFYESAETVCALGSQDKSISIWQGGNPRPLVVAMDLFDDSVTDICWTSSGLELLASSVDGTVAYFKFESSDIGSPVSQKEMTELLQKRHGQLDVSDSTPAFAENPEQLDVFLNHQHQQQQLQHQQQQKQLNGAPVPMDTDVVPRPAKIAFPASPMKQALPVTQQESRGKDGRRRIVPQLLLGAEDDTASATASASAASTAPARESARTTQTTAIGTHSETAATTIPVRAILPKKPSPSESARPQTSRPPQQPQQQQQQQQQYAPAAPKAPTAAAPGQNPLLQRSNKDKDVAKSRSLPVSSTNGLSTAGKASTGGGASLPSSVRSTVFTDETALLPPIEPLQRLHVSLPGTLLSRVFEAENAHDFDASWLSLSTLGGGDHASPWRVLIDYTVHRIAATANHVIAVGENGLSILSMTGQKLLPTILISYGVHSVTVQENDLLILSRDAKLSIWNLELLTCSANSHPFGHLIPSAPLAASQDGSDSIGVEAQIVPSGVVVLLIPSVYKAYALDPTLRTWILVVDGASPLYALSEHSAHLPASLQGTSRSAPAGSVVPMDATDGQPRGVSHVGPLSSLQIQLGRVSFANIRLSTANDSELQRHATLSYLEHQVSSSLVLLSANEYTYWLSVLAKFAAGKNMSDRLLAIFDTLLPRPSSSSSLSPSPFIAPVATASSNTRLHQIMGERECVALARELLGSIRDISSSAKVQTKVAERLRQLEM